MKERLKKYIGDKAFYKMAFAIIIPVVIQQIILSIAGYVDNLMINGYSTISYTGVSTANRFMFVINFFWIGLASGIAVFIAQYHGAKNKEKVTATIQLAMIIAIIFGLISIVTIYYAGPAVLKLFIPGQSTTDLEAISAGVHYIQVIAYGGVIMLLNFMVSTIFRSLGKPKIPLIAGLVGIIVNIVLNFVFIYGYLGVPEIGATGAAVATVISKLVELLILIVYAFFFSENQYARKIWKRFLINSNLIIMYLKKGLPIILNEILWAIGVQILARLITAGNTDWLTAFNYSQNVTDLFFVYYSGIATGTAVLVGQALGEGAFDKAKDYANKLIGIIFFASILAIVLLVSISPALLLILTKPGPIYWQAYYLILITSVFIILYGYNAVVYFVLRAGGDSLRSFFLDQGPTFLIGIPLAFLLHEMEPTWQLGLLGIFAATRVIDVVKIFFSRYFYKKETWVRNLTTGDPSN